MQNAVEVVFLDGVEVNEHEVSRADAGECLSDHRADAAETDDPDDESCEVGLGVWSPDRDGAREAAVADNPYGVAILALMVASCSRPHATTPALVRGRERHAKERLVR